MSSVYNHNWQAFGGLPAFLYVWSALVVIMPTGFQTYNVFITYIDLIGQVQSELLSQGMQSLR